VRLREQGLIDKNDAPIAGALSEAGGFLKVRVDYVRELGNREALALVQLQSFGSLRMSRRIGRHLQVSAKQLASLIGGCADTATALLTRLSTGLTNRVKAAQRKGERVVAKARIELVRALGHASRVRLLAEREIKPSAPVAPRSSTPPNEATVGYVPSPEELRAMLRAATPHRVP
jgi:hypothetical protein